jgi:hypothetical protein
MSDQFDALGDRTAALADAMEALAAAAESARAAAAAAAAPGAEPTGTVGVTAGGEGGGGAFAALSGLSAGATAAAGALLALPDMIKGFVEAFNPYLVEQFNVAMSNISATIGSALEPAMMVFLDVARQANDIIAPLFEQLRPVIEGVASEFASRLMPVLKLLVEVAMALVPVFQIVNEAMRPLQALLPAMANILRLVVAGLVGLFESFGNVLSPIKDVSDRLVKAIKEATKGLIIFAAQFAQFLGLNKVVESIQKAFAPVKAGAGKVAAPKDVAITDMGAILREATAAAFTAQGTAQKGVEDWLGDISGDLKKSLENQAQFAAQVEGVINKILAAAGMPLTVENIKKIYALLVEFRGRLKDMPAPRDIGNAAGAAALDPFGLLDLLGRLRR